MDGHIEYVDEASGDVSSAHPLLPHFQQLVHLNRHTKGFTSNNPKLPKWLQQASDCWVQFCNGEGSVYFYDFATGAIADDFPPVIKRMRQAHQATR